MRASVSSDEIASARISCSDRSLKFFATAFPTVMSQGWEYYFFAAAGVDEVAGGGAIRTVVPVVRESDGLTITVSDSVTPLRISDCIQKWRPALTSRSCTTPLASTMPTC